MKISIKNGANESHAFTLIDVVVAMGVLGIVLTSLFASFSFGFNVIKLSREELQATQILQEKLEEVRLYNWTNATQVNGTFTNQFGQMFFFGSISNSIPDTDAAYSNELRKITVTVNWTNNNTRYSRSTSTYVSHYGLFNYALK